MTNGPWEAEGGQTQWDIRMTLVNPNYPKDGSGHEFCKGLSLASMPVIESGGKEGVEERGHPLARSLASSLAATHVPHVRTKLVIYSPGL